MLVFRISEVIDLTTFLEASGSLASLKSSTDWVSLFVSVSLGAGASLISALATGLSEVITGAGRGAIVGVAIGVVGRIGWEVTGKLVEDSEFTIPKRLS